MIEKVLIAEDYESANISVQKTLQDLGIVNVDHVYYCDDALSKIVTAVKRNQSYDLLITDLYFDEDMQTQKLSGGQALIEAAREAQPDLKILVFSGESKSAILDHLYNNLQIDGYVRKARNDSKELFYAITELSQNRRHLPRPISELINKKNVHNFSDYDITIISLLATGMAQKNIPAFLEKRNIRPSGLSSIEKRLSHIRTVLNFSKNEQLVAFCKDMGII